VTGEVGSQPRLDVVRVGHLVFPPPNGSRLSCGRARTNLAPTGRRRRSLPRTRRRPAKAAARPDRGRQLQPLVGQHAC
jgi:hypothetical protein